MDDELKRMPTECQKEYIYGQGSHPFTDDLFLFGDFDDRIFLDERKSDGNEGPYSNFRMDSFF